MLEKGELDRRILLQKRVQAFDADGAPIVGPSAGYADIRNVWAQKKFLKDQGTERVIGADIQAQSEIAWVIDWANDLYKNGANELGPECRVVYDDQSYDIFEIEEIGRREGLRLKTRLRTVVHAS